MKKVLKFFGYLLLFVLILAALAAVGYWVLFVKLWPWWIFAVIVACVFGVFAGYAAIKKFLIRRNEKKFVQQVIHEESVKAEKSSRQDTFSQEGMEAQWKESVDKLKKSHLRKFGNPLYVLPWYILLGESRSGKTSAIKHANLSSTLTDVSPATIIAGTKHCDWWFLEQAIILDTAGRYAIPIEEETDKKEWQAFLTLMSKYRKKEPVNGAIVTVAANALLTEDPHVLSEKAGSIRQRINQMMRIMGAKFPVYLMVTKMDLVNGFTDFCSHISDRRYDGVMGYLNETGEKDSSLVLDHCMTSVYEQVKKLHSHIFHNRINHFAVSFSNEFMGLRPGLEAYVRSLFSDDIYQATPLFRGIYFSSACRKGKPESEFLKTAGISYDHDASLDRNKSYFLRNFFGAILPKDRNVFTPLTEFLMWQRATISLSVFSIILVLLGMTGVVAFSYKNNISALDTLNPSYFKESPVTLDISTHILRLDRQRFEINKLAEGNSSWILPRMGLHQSLSLERKLKRQYIADVVRYLVEPLDDLFFDRVNVINSQTPYDEVVDAAVYTVKRISLLRSSVEGDAFSQKKEFEKSIQSLFPHLDPTIEPAIALRFAGIYYHYLEWNRDKAGKALKLVKYRETLSKIAERSDNFNWIVSDRVSTAADVVTADFVKGFTTTETISSPKAFISGAFTKAGRTEVEQFVKMIQEAFTAPGEFEQIESGFWAWYNNEFYTEWFDFASVFPPAGSWRSIVKNWPEMGPLMAGDQNPYFLVLSRMGDEIESMKKRTDATPLWAEAVLRLKTIKTLAETETKKKEGSFMAKLSMTKEKLADKLEKAGEKAAYNAIDLKKEADLEYNLKFAEKWNAYNDGLKSLSEATAYREKCFHMFSDYFEALSDSSKEGKPYNRTYKTLVELKAFLKQNETSPVVLNLITGPFDFLGIYGAYKSVLYLQKKWEEMVISPSIGIDPDNFYTIMFDKTNGLIWKFVNDEAAPFIEQSRIGFASKKAYGIKLPFTNQFLRLLGKGEKLAIEHQNEYPVTLETSPLDMNRGALIRPYSNTLTLECADQKTILVNRNFLETAKFLWKPATCGDVILEIEFEDKVVTKRYPGKLGFARFLADFQDGSKRFAVTDFPDATGYLTNKNVTDINVSYKIRGIEPVLTFLDRRPPALPEVIFTTIKRQSGTYPIPQRDLPGPVPAKALAGPKLKDHYDVVMKTVPMGTNPSATTKPISGIFWMNCDNQVIRFENNNYPRTQRFTWRPASCGKVVLIIHFPELAVVKEYKDFFEFVKDFGYKSRTFTMDEFPKQKDALLKMGVTAIKVAYEFEGDLPLLESRTIREGIQAPTFHEIKVKTRPKNAAAGAPGVPAAPAASAGTKTPPSLQKNEPKPAPQEKPVRKADQENKPVPAGDDKFKAWIRAQDARHYTINVLLSPFREKTVEFARTHNLLENGAVYPTSVKGKNRYNLIYGSFATFQQANKTLGELPGVVRKNAPWIRQFAQIKKAIE